MATKVFLILPFQGVAGRTEAQGEKLIVPAWAADRTLYQSRHRLHYSFGGRVQNLNVHQPTMH